MGECARCESLSPEVHCSLCKKWFCYACAQVKEIIFKKKSEDDKAQFACPNCRSIRSKNQTVVNQPPDGIPEIPNMISEMRAEMRKSQNEMSKRLKEIADSQSFLSSRYDDILIAMNNMGEILKTVQGLEEKVRKQEKELAELRQQVQLNDQYGRRRQLEFHGVRTQSTENLQHSIIDIAKKIDIDLKPDDFDAIHRLSPRNKSKKDCPDAIIVEFTNRRVRDQLLLNRRKLKNNQRQKDSVQIYESLSPYFKNLLWKSKVCAKEKNHKFVWFQKNKIMVRKAEGAPIIYIHKEEDLKTLK